MANNPAVFLIGAGQESGDIDEGDQGDVEGITKAHKSRAFDRCIDVQGAGQVSRLVGHHPDALTVQASEADNQVGSEQCLDFQEMAIVNHTRDHLAHVVRNVLTLGDDLL